MKLSLVQEMKEIDKKTVEQYGLPELLLMENAGHRVAEAMIELLGGAAGKNGDRLILRTQTFGAGDKP